MRRTNPQVKRDRCCRQLFFAHYIDGERPLVVLECCRCGRFWHQRENGTLMPYDRVVERISCLTQGAEGGCMPDIESGSPRRAVS